MFWFFFLERYHWTEKVSEAGDGDFKVVFSFKVLENQTGTKAQDWKVPGPVHTRQPDQNTIQTSASSSSVGPSAAREFVPGSVWNNTFSQRVQRTTVPGATFTVRDETSPESGCLARCSPDAASSTGYVLFPQKNTKKYFKKTLFLVYEVRGGVRL
jgi:hypothetical protein